jgi:exodeoxyribonuclease III
VHPRNEAPRKPGTSGIENHSELLLLYTFGIKKGNGGVGLFTRDKPADIRYRLPVEDFDDENRVIVADYEKFILLNIYFPNGKASKERLE